MLKKISNVLKFYAKVNSLCFVDLYFGVKILEKPLHIWLIEHDTKSPKEGNNDRSGFIKMKTVSL